MSNEVKDCFFCGNKPKIILVTEAGKKFATATCEECCFSFELFPMNPKPDVEDMMQEIRKAWDDNHEYEKKYAINMFRLRKKLGEQRVAEAIDALYPIDEETNLND